MKILLILIFIFNLISGPVGCFDVIGYPGGSVRIYCKQTQNGLSNKYFCKEKTKQCTHVKTQHSWVHKDRLSLIATPKCLTVVYRDLRVEDAGSYQCGGTGVWNHTVNLRVKTDPCCSGSTTVIGYPGKTTTINCFYPEEFLTYTKYFFKLDVQSFIAVVDTAEHKRGRFSIFEDRSSRVVSVRISNLRETDRGVYYCSVGIERNPVGFHTLFPKIHLWVSVLFKDSKETLRPRTTIQPTSVTYRRTSAAPAAPTVTISAEEPSTPGSSTIIIISITIITVSICVALLLIGGLTLIFYKLRYSKIEDSPITRRRSGTNDIVYENDLFVNQDNIRMGPIYHNLEPNPNQPDSVYQSLDSRSKDPDSVYHTLNPNTNQIQSARD